MKYQPTYASISRHEVPAWYNDAKFGIFIHWGLFSVPGWAFSERGRSIWDIYQEDEFAGQMYNPYAEWYLNSLRIEGSPTQEYHHKKYGESFDYFDFKKAFSRKSSNMDPERWARIFQKAGVKYVVMFTKHHDGYCLWPSAYKNPYIENYQSQRDLVGELTDAVRTVGLKMGLYYSGIFDWSFIRHPMNSAVKWLDHYLPSNTYAQYSLNQTLELIHIYQPSVLWNDMGYPPQCDLDALFSEYYNTVPDGVTNNRWVQRKLKMGQTEEEYAEELVSRGEISRLDDGKHGDFLTPEYVQVNDIPAQKWESCRGIGMSFGYNRNEDPSNFMKGKDVIYSLADIVSKNGNLLLNIGPMADGTIQEEQVKPLLETGEWLDENGEAIYGTSCWKRPDGKTSTEKEVRFTRKGENFYAIVLDDQPGEELIIRDLQIPDGTTVHILGEREKLN